jgi:GMP synthase (glutamine-hydrolysing)
MKKDGAKNTDKVAILDAGAQYGKVIDRRVRELGVESNLLPFDTSATELKNYRAIILSGGPESVYSPKAPAYDPKIFELGLPILGICYGMHLINYVMGGTVEKKSRREDGPCVITVDPTSRLFEGFEKEQDVLMSHGDTIDQVGPGFRVIADSNGLHAAMENPDKKMFAVQFHPEVDLSKNGKQVISNFLFKIVGMEKNFTVGDRKEIATEHIKEKVKDGQVIVLVSGGVDSAVCAALLHEALKPEQIIALHIDHGFMRKDESKKVIEALKNVGLTVMSVDASERFATATTKIDGKETLPLSETTSPEEKRKIIGDTFVKVTEQELAKLDLNLDKVFLVQGTLRPDLIESASTLASKKADTIKTHHNDTQLIRELRQRGRVIEPLSEYHKDEVRELGTQLGLPAELVWRQPFPGPGLAIRILCAEEPYLTDSFSQVEKNLAQLGTEQISVSLLAARTVGVQGDGRTYSYLAALSGETNWKTLFELARKIPKEVHQVNRVVYVFGEKLETVQPEITPTKLSPDVVQQLQDADDIVNQVLQKYDLIRSLSQVPVVLFPVNFGKEGKRSIGIRTFITNDFMTGVPAFPGKEMPLQALEEMVERIIKNDNRIARVVYDLTSKPPGTTEWE